MALLVPRFAPLSPQKVPARFCAPQNRCADRPFDFPNAPFSGNQLPNGSSASEVFGVNLRRYKITIPATADDTRSGRGRLYMANDRIGFLKKRRAQQGATNCPRCFSWFLSCPPSDSGKFKWVVHLETEIGVDQVAWRESPIHSFSYRRKTTGGLPQEALARLLGRTDPSGLRPGIFGAKLP
jgi:hypothetical protein